MDLCSLYEAFFKKVIFAPACVLDHCVCSDLLGPHTLLVFLWIDLFCMGHNELILNTRGRAGWLDTAETNRGRAEQSVKGEENNKRGRSVTIERGTLEKKKDKNPNYHGSWCFSKRAVAWVYLVLVCDPWIVSSDSLLSLTLEVKSERKQRVTASWVQLPATVEQ